MADMIHSTVTIIRGEVVSMTTASIASYPSDEQLISEDLLILRSKTLNIDIMRE